MYQYDRPSLKKAAKRDIKGIYWQLVLIVFVSTMIQLAISAPTLFVGSGLTFGINIASMLITGPLTYGLCHVFTDVLRKKECKLSTLFVGFKRFGDTFLLGLLKWIFIFLWSLLFAIPGLIKMIAYSMSSYIQRDNPDMTANECLQASIRLTNGNKGKIFMLNLSFIGWYLLAFGIPSMLVSGVFTYWDLAGITSIDYGTTVYEVAFNQGFIRSYLGSLAGSICAIFIAPYISMANARMYDFLILNYNEQNGAAQTEETNAYDENVNVETAEIAETVETAKVEDPFEN